MIDRLAALPAREKTGLVLAVLLVVVLVVDALVAKPLFRNLDAQDAAIAEARIELSAAQEILSLEASVAEQYAEVKDLLGVSAPEPEAIEALKNELDEMAIRQGVTLRSMRHREPERTDFLVTYIIEIGDFETEAPALIRFLDSISTAPGLMRVRQLAVTSQQTNRVVSGSMQVTKVMTLSEDGETRP